MRFNPFDMSSMYGPSTTHKCSFYDRYETHLWPIDLSRTNLWPICNPSRDFYVIHLYSIPLFLCDPFVIHPITFIWSICDPSQIDKLEGENLATMETRWFTYPLRFVALVWIAYLEPGIQRSKFGTHSLSKTRR